MNVIERPLNYDKRLAGQLATWAIKKDSLRALVELITNSDDSYRRFAAEGLRGSGLIKVRINRKRSKGPSIIEVIDEAEGFDYETMDKRVGTYASDTSGFTEGKSVRGYFGRGLKDAILGMGEGKVQSLKDMYYFECSLTQEKFILKEPKLLNKREQKVLEDKLGIRQHGTRVTIYVTKPGVSVPHFDKLVEQLEMYYSLRDIIDSDKRTLIISMIDDKGNEKSTPQKLKYKSPVGDLILDSDIEIPYNSSSPPAHLSVWKAKDHLEQHGPYREGGILISGKNTIYDISLFGFETDPYANRLFGRLKCEFIDDLLKKEEPIVSDERDGLDWKHHPFSLALKKVVEEQLKPIVRSIKQDEEDKRRDIENERTRQRHIAAVKRLNKIAQQELGPSIDTGTTNGDDEPTSALPPSGFDFIPAYYKVLVGRRSTLCLKLTVPWIIPDGTVVTIETDNEDLEIVENRSSTVHESTADKNDVVTINPKIVGRRVGIDGILTAIAGETKTEAMVEVVSRKVKKVSKKKRREAKEGLFSGITYDPALDPRIRHYFDRRTGKISISSNAPSVKKYLGPNGEGQDYRHCQVLVAELVNDAVCRELARLKAERGALLPLGGDITAAVDKEIDQLVYKYAHTIHDILVDKQSANLHLHS